MNKTSATFANIIHATAKIEELAGAVLMAATLLFFVIWFGWNMHNYLGNIEVHRAATDSNHVLGGEYAKVPPNTIVAE